MVKTLLAVTALFFAVSVARGGEILLSAGMSHADAVGVLAGVAIDMGPFIDFASPTGEKPKLICWEVKHNGAVIWLYDTIDRKVWAFGYWPKEAFQVDVRKAKAREQMVGRITIDTDKNTVKVEKSPEYFAGNAPNPATAAIYGGMLSDLKEPVLAGKEKDAGVSALRVFYFSCDPARRAVVRYETRGDRCYRRSMLLNDRTTQKKAKEKEVEVPKKELDNAMAALEKIGFWKMPKEDNAIAPEPSSDQDNSGSHGTIVIVEAVKGGKYLARLRLGPWYQTEERGLAPLVKFYAKALEVGGPWKKAEKKADKKVVGKSEKKTAKKAAK